MTINGENTNWYEGMTVEDLITAVGYEKNRIAVECNGEIVPKADYTTVTLKEKDKLEVVSFVGGG